MDDQKKRYRPMIKVAIGQAEGFETLKTTEIVITKCEQLVHGTQPRA